MPLAVPRWQLWHSFSIDHRERDWGLALSGAFQNRVLQSAWNGLMMAFASIICQLSCQILPQFACACARSSWADNGQDAYAVALPMTAALVTSNSRWQHQLPFFDPSFTKFYKQNNTPKLFNTQYYSMCKSIRWFSGKLKEIINVSDRCSFVEFIFNIHIYRLIPFQQ